MKFWQQIFKILFYSKHFKWYTQYMYMLYYIHTYIYIYNWCVKFYFNYRYVYIHVHIYMYIYVSLKLQNIFIKIYLVLFFGLFWVECCFIYVWCPGYTLVYVFPTFNHVFVFLSIFNVLYHIFNKLSICFFTVDF